VRGVSVLRPSPDGKGEATQPTKRAFADLWSRFAPLLRKRATAEEPSRIVVTASIGGLTVNPGPAYAHSYVTSKAAVIHLARNLAVELAPSNILVNAIAPGVFPSKLASGLIDISGGAEELGKTSPNGRLGRPEDIAAAVVYLCSRAASHVVGDVLVLDGGNALAGPMVRRKEKL
jgi:NAD(P)-dependent dehydrogenase (short-subunit alcohol dehydrogenase family)